MTDQKRALSIQTSFDTISPQSDGPPSAPINYGAISFFAVPVQQTTPVLQTPPIEPPEPPDFPPKLA
jgi:hypothetical protein